MQIKIREHYAYIYVSEKQQIYGEWLINIKLNLKSLKTRVKLLF